MMSWLHWLHNKHNPRPQQRRNLSNDDDDDHNDNELKQNWRSSSPSSSSSITSCRRVQLVVARCRCLAAATTTTTTTKLNSNCASLSFSLTFSPCGPVCFFNSGKPASSLASTRAGRRALGGACAQRPGESSSGAQSTGGRLSPGSPPGAAARWRPHTMVSVVRAGGCADWSQLLPFANTGAVVVVVAVATC